MDPDACLTRIEDAYDEYMCALAISINPSNLWSINDRILAAHEMYSDACQDLHTWLVKGGFEPDWDRQPKGTLAYQTWFAKAMQVK